MSNHKRFYHLLDSCPWVSTFWDRETHDLDVERFESELDVMSSGEQHMARFLASVWFGNNKLYGFDLAKAASRLDPEDRQIIIKWLASPFYP